MEQVLHDSARTTPTVRPVIQANSENLIKLAARYGLDPKTVAKVIGLIYLGCVRSKIEWYMESDAVGKCQTAVLRVLKLR